MKITQEVRAFAIEQAGRRCECSGGDCRHHRHASRCKRGLRGDDWKVYWRSEKGGATRENIQAWCLECFGNNFAAPRETVALLAPDVAEFARLFEEDPRRAITLKSILHDAAERAARECRGRVVLERFDDDVIVEFKTSTDALEAARALRAGFLELAERLDLPTPEVSGAIHCGEITRWRNGLLAGEAIEVTARLRRLAGVGQIVLTEPAVAPFEGLVEVEPLPEDASGGDPTVGAMWALRF